MKRNSAGRRIYSAEQLEKLQTIKHLLKREKLTVKGARSRLAKMKDSPDKLKSKDPRQALLWVQKELISIRNSLAAGPQS